MHALVLLAALSAPADAQADARAAVALALAVTAEKPAPAPVAPVKPSAPTVCAAHGCVCGCLEGKPCCCGNASKSRSAEAVIHSAPAVQYHQPATVTYGQPFPSAPPPAAGYFRPVFSPPPVMFRAAPGAARFGGACGPTG